MSDTESRDLTIEFIKSEEGVRYFTKWIKDYFKEIVKKSTVEGSNTKVDPALKALLMAHYKLTEEASKRLKEHSEIMMLENLCGLSLEQYINSNCENKIIWCPGQAIHAVDFLIFNEDKVIFLQVKNKNNTENSSSSKVRKNTCIEKWYRMDAKSGKHKWHLFTLIGHSLSEEAYLNFIKEKFK